MLATGNRGRAALLSAAHHSPGQPAEISILPHQADSGQSPGDSRASVPGADRLRRVDHRGWCLCTGSELVKTLLLTRRPEFPKGGVQVEVLKPVFGNAMHAAEPREWRWQRGAAAPLFRYDELLQYGPIMNAAARSDRRELAGSRAGTRPQHPQGYDAGGISRHFEHDAGRRRGTNVRRHRERTR